VSAAEAAPVSAAEAKALFDGFAGTPVLLLAVSGGPDSTALLLLAARWRAARKRGPELLAITVDHGLRPDSAREAGAVKRLAARLGVKHRTLRWSGRKPAAGLQEAARAMRYRLLGDAARNAGGRHILTGHTLDDQAETVVLRLARGSGLTGLGAMARVASLPTGEDNDILLVRPLLDLPKARLLATLAAAGLVFADDPSNRDPRFTRARLRGLMPLLAKEGLDARRLALLARRLRRAEATLELAVDAAEGAVLAVPWTGGDTIMLAAEKFLRLPAEVALRLLGRAIARTGDEGPVELGKLEALYGNLTGSGQARIRRTLAGALVTLTGAGLTVERAPPRSAARRRRSTALTTRQYGGRRLPKGR
jgi:tRNA(Ile)-lysidine synthase